MTTPERVETLVIGGGQAGLAAGYHLARAGRPFLVVDAMERIGDTWRNRWDSLRLFSPARYDALPGMPFPARPDAYPTKDEMADYLERYADHFEIPVRTGVRVTRLTRKAGRFLAEADGSAFEAEHVIVAMSSHQRPRVPPFAAELDPSIRQLHSSDYRNPAQLRDGAVLVVGAGNSGAEIALETVRDHPTILSGRHPGQIPFRIDRFIARHLLVRLVLGFGFNQVLNVGTPIGRRMRPKLGRSGMPLVRTKASDLERAGIQRVARVRGTEGGRPVLDDGRVLDVANVIWATGSGPGFEWIDVPGMSQHGPTHERGVVRSVPGLYFVGLAFQYAVASGLVQGVGRDAAWVVRDLVAGRAGVATERAPATAGA